MEAVKFGGTIVVGVAVWAMFGKGVAMVALAVLAVILTVAASIERRHKEVLDAIEKAGEDSQ